MLFFDQTYKRVHMFRERERERGGEEKVGEKHTVGICVHSSNDKINADYADLYITSCPRYLANKI